MTNWGLYWILSSQMTKTFTDNCYINILQQTSCESPFPHVQMQSKHILFLSFCNPMYASQLWCNFRKSCMQRLRVAYNFGCRALYNLTWRASVSSHQVQCNIPTFDALLRQHTYPFLERCRNSNNVWLRALMPSDCFYSSLIFEHYDRILLCEWVWSIFAVSVWLSVIFFSLRLLPIHAYIENCITKPRQVEHLSF